jgi:hypothetical protein
MNLRMQSDRQEFCELVCLFDVLLIYFKCALFAVSPIVQGDRDHNVCLEISRIKRRRALCQITFSQFAFGKDLGFNIPRTRGWRGGAPARPIWPLHLPPITPLTSPGTIVWFHQSQRRVPCQRIAHLSTSPLTTRRRTRDSSV